MARPPSAFRPRRPPRYGGGTSALDFLREYERSMLAAGGCDRCLMRYLPLATKGPALAWLLNLEDESIGMWEELRRRFLSRFRNRDCPYPLARVLCILGGTQAPLSNHHGKRSLREVNATCMSSGASKPLGSFRHKLDFNISDHPKTTGFVGAIPLICTPTISGAAVSKTLIDGGAGLNVISLEAFEKLWIPRERLTATGPFVGATNGITIPLGRVRLPVTFGTCQNYRPETLDFVVAHIGLPYNVILGYPALTKFTAAVHHAYNLIKMPGSSGTLTIHGDVKDAVCYLEHAYKEAAASHPADSDDVDHLAAPPN